MNYIPFHSVQYESTNYPTFSVNDIKILLPDSYNNPIYTLSSSFHSTRPLHSIPVHMNQQPPPSPPRAHNQHQHKLSTGSGRLFSFFGLIINQININIWYNFFSNFQKNIWINTTFNQPNQTTHPLLVTRTKNMSIALLIWPIFSVKFSIGAQVKLKSKEKEIFPTWRTCHN